ncbi:MAG: type II CAAX endopeptidase family protein [Anaerolineae bacterium]|nr:CPBP family intramembrane metalloprotease [Thermoflexales bacterium]MDW8407699.1 type II CAAX endopeptidase family protein [Anaerolineae bacterium]
MNSLSEPDSSATSPAAQESTAQENLQAGAPAAHHARVTVWDWGVRLAIWAALVALFAVQLGEPLNGPAMFPLLLSSLFAGGFILASVPSVAQTLRRAALAEPIALSLAPLSLLVPYVTYAPADGTTDTSHLLITGILLFLPTALGILNTPDFRRADLTLGLVTVAAPLILPLVGNQSFDLSDVALRLGAFLLPVALLIFTGREQKRTLNFLFVCAVLSVWYAVELNAFPHFGLIGAEEWGGYFRLAVLPLFVFLLAISGQFERVGLSFRPTARAVSITASNVILLAGISVPIGLFSGFLTPEFAAPLPLDAATSLLTGFVFAALPAEILFRGTILTYLEQTLRLPQSAATVISAILFAFAHIVYEPTEIGWRFVLAVIAGIFYARIYLATRNVVAAGAAHAVVNWLWSVVFAGGAH